MKIVGIGTDIIETKRIRELTGNRKFVRRIFAQAEIEYCERKKNRTQHYAVRFAAKEAVWKAYPRPKPCELRDIQISNTDDGKPEVKVANSGVNKYKIFLSLSHCHAYAVAYAVITTGR